MKWQVAIDIKWWEDENCLLLYDLLEYAKGKNWLSIMFSDRLYQMIFPGNIFLLSSVLQQISRDPYSLYTKSNIILSPDIAHGLANDEVQEIEGVLFNFLQENEPPHKLYAITAGRNKSSDKFLHIQEKTSKDIDILTVSCANSLSSFLQAHRPILNQAKHISQQQRNIGGYSVSTFKAWNSRDSSYAEQLLNNAFDDSGAQLLPPDELFIWDPRNETYVRFMHSGNWEYHGHDFDEYERIPDLVKKRYNHWKK